LFSETLLSQTVANTISEQTGAEILYIYSMGNLSKDEFESGLTFLDMMEHNLTQYRIGLGYDETDHTH
jgi:zinc transport system substrate-binding protein